MTKTDQKRPFALKLNILLTKTKTGKIDPKNAKIERKEAKRAVTKRELMFYDKLLTLAEDLQNEGRDAESKTIYKAVDKLFGK